MASISDVEGDALDLLEREDLELRRLFTMLRQRRGVSVEERAEYGGIAKEVIHQLAVREAALVDVAVVAAEDPGLKELGERLEEHLHKRRPLVDRIEKMSRGVQGINLRIGQDFDAAMEDVIQVVGTEIEWDLGLAIPTVKGAMGPERRKSELRRAAHLERHAPTHLDPKGPRWWERAPVVSRLITIYDQVRDFPQGRGARTR
jgi:hypothetical protein